MNYCNLAQHFLIKNCQKNSTPRSITLREVDFLNFEFEYLSENEFLCKTILACLTGVQMGSIYEKIETENLVTLPL